MSATIYLEVTRAAEETVTKLLAQRGARPGRPFEVRVTGLGGSTASVDLTGNVVTVNMPTMPAHAPLGRGEADRLVGFIAHEVLHVLHTNFSAWQTAVRCGSHVQAWTNTLEDVRIEHKEIRAGHFPALRSLLASLMDHQHYKALVKSKDVRVIGSDLRDAAYCAAVLGRVANKYDIPTARTLRAGMSPDVTALVEKALGRIRACRTTWDVVTLARELANDQAAMAPPPPPPPPPPPSEPEPQPEPPPEPEPDQDDQNDQGADGASDDQGAPGDDASDDQDDQGADGASDDQGAPGDDASDDQDDASPAPGNVPGDGHGDGTGADADLDLDAPATLEDMVQGVRDRTMETAAVGNGLVGYRNERMTVHARNNGNELASAWNMALPGRAILHGQISRLLVSMERTWTTHRETSGRIDRRALARLDTGAPDVFSQRHDRPGMDTALAILIDLSGSMSRRIETARVAAFHIATAAEDAGAKVAVYGFYTSELNANLAHDPLPASQLVAMIPFGMSPRACCDRIGALSPHLSTPLSPAILGAAEDLRDQVADRHILMVLTDGDCDFGNSTVTQACHVAAAWGVETVGIGIDAMNVIRAFPDGHSVNVVDLAQLGATGLGVLCDMLEDAATE